MLGFVLNLDIIYFLKLTVFLELRSKKTVRVSEQIMSTDKYPRIFFSAPNRGYCKYIVALNFPKERKKYRASCTIDYEFGIYLTTVEHRLTVT